MEKKLKQHEIFSKEGDNWFGRNKEILIDEESEKTVNYLSQIINYLKENKLNFDKVFEIGCSNGWRLNKIRNIFKADCYGIEPSKLALRDGKKRYPSLKLTQGFSHDLSDFKDDFFDLVIISFVFHWVDRSKLLQSVSEIDRVLKNFGYLIIEDFNPGSACKVPYHHLSDKEVYTYKQNYSDIFVGSKLYNIINSKEYEFHKGGGIDSQNLCHFTVLQKRLENNYILARREIKT
ncbi:MAG: class I SAM-dependent methyltransferase [Patescibacteria group bacterium]